MSDAGRNLAVLLTPPGAGAIAVIRLYGLATAAFAAAHLSRPPRIGRCVHADIIDDGAVVDDAVIVQTPAGALDLNVHGGTWVTEAVLQLAERCGFVRADWDDVPDVSLDSADDIERQVELDLPRAKSRDVIRLLAAQPAAWRAMLADADPAGRSRALSDRSLEVALRTPTVAIVGPANVGKSTLANALFGRDHSITADVPGTTRDWVGELADLDGLVVRLVDTPGLRDTPDPIEAAAIRQAEGVVAAADLMLVTMDGSDARGTGFQPVTFVGQRTHGLETRATENALLVLTKSDLPTASAPPVDAIRVSAVRGDGLAELRQAIRRRLGCDDLKSLHARCWTPAQRRRISDSLSLPAGVSTIAGPATDRPGL